MRRLTVFCVLIVVAWATAALGDGDNAIDKARDLVRAGKTAEAKQVLQAHVATEPGDGLAWVTLANIYHTEGDYEKAAEMNRRAAETPYVRGSAKYNEACALSLLGRVDQANEALHEAIKAGFLDYDLMETDSDLDALRAKYDIAYPPEHEYTPFKARNAVELSFRVLRPRGYDGGKSYPAVVVFPPGNGRRSTDWAMEELLGEGDDTKGWIVIYVVGPDRGWFTHPSHHALEDMLKKIQSEYKITGGKFHVAGFADGARAATTYSRMSEAYFQTLTTFSAWHWRRWDADELGREFRDMSVTLVVGEQDAFGREMNDYVKKLMSEGGGTVKLEIVSRDDYMLASIRHGRMIDYLPR